MPFRNILAEQIVQISGKGIEATDRQINKLHKSLLAVEARSAAARRGLSGFNSGLMGRFGGAGSIAAIGGGTLAVAGIAAATKAAIELEQGFAQVRKTTGLAGGEFRALQDDLLDLSSAMKGVSTSEIQEIAAAAGQLGIRGRQSIKTFTEEIAMMAATSDLSAEAAATLDAQILNIFEKPAEDARRLNAVMTRLAANTVATEGQIADLTLRMGGAGRMLGLTIPQIQGIAAALREAGSGVEVGGTAMSQIFSKMMQDVEGFARVAGVELEKFREMVEKRPIEAVIALFEGLSKLSKTEAAEALHSIHLRGAEVINTTAKMSMILPKLKASLEMANKEWNSATATFEEYEIQANTTANTIANLENNVNRLGSAIGGYFLEATKGAASNLSDMSEELARFFELAQKEGIFGATFGESGDAREAANAKIGWIEAFQKSQIEVDTAKEAVEAARGTKEFAAALEAYVEVLGKHIQAVSALPGAYQRGDVDKIMSERFKARQELEKAKAGETAKGPQSEIVKNAAKQFLGGGGQPGILGKFLGGITAEARVAGDRAKGGLGAAIFGPDGIGQKIAKWAKGKQGNDEDVIADAARRLGAAKADKRDFQPQMFDPVEFKNQLQLAAFKKPEDQLDILREIAEKQPKKEDIDYIKRLINEGVLALKDGNLIITGG